MSTSAESEITTPLSSQLSTSSRDGGSTPPESQSDNGDNQTSRGVFKNVVIFTNKFTDREDGSRYLLGYLHQLNLSIVLIFPLELYAEFRVEASSELNIPVNDVSLHIVQINVEGSLEMFRTYYVLERPIESPRMQLVIDTVEVVREITNPSAVLQNLSGSLLAPVVQTGPVQTGLMDINVETGETTFHEEEVEEEPVEEERVEEEEESEEDWEEEEDVQEGLFEGLEEEDFSITLEDIDLPEEDITVPEEDITFPKQAIESSEEDDDESEGGQEVGLVELINQLGSSSQSTTSSQRPRQESLESQLPIATTSAKRERSGLSSQSSASSTHTFFDEDGEVESTRVIRRKIMKSEKGKGKGKGKKMVFDTDSEDEEEGFTFNPKDYKDV